MTEVYEFEEEATIEATFQIGVTAEDHGALYNRDAPNQHPISAITDLQTTLDGISGDISAETTRAEGVEGSLSNLTTDDKTNLVSAINEVDSHADTNTNNLANEVTRAKSVEGVLSNLTTTNKTNLVEAINEVDSNSDTNATNLSNHISDKNNPHEVTKAQVGLGNVDNTADLDKPISTATQTALDGKQNNLSQAQLDAVNSGITQALVTQIGTNQNDITTINGKIPSDASSSNQLADKSYVDTADGGLQTQITANAGDIDTIEGKIPSAASSSNQLADKNFVNSSISTNTATFIGTFNSVAELEAYSGTLTNNDYAFVIVTDSLGNTAYDRYKYTTATTPASWLFEYELNNSSFTADQWAAINSGANTTNIGQIATNTSAISGLSTSKQDKIDSSNKLDSDLVDDNGQTNKFVTSAEKAQISTNASNITSLQSGKADKATTLSGYGITDAYTKTEVDTALNGKQDNLTTAQLNAVNSGITSAKVTQYDGYATSKANVGLDNLNADGQMIVDSVDGKISNCILEIPQNIKVTLENNIVTLKSGSKVCIPNSVYTEVETTTDKTWNGSASGTNTILLVYYPADGTIKAFAVRFTESGSSFTINDGIWFDTSNIVIKRIVNGSTSYSGISFPFAVTKSTNGVITDIQVFNGAGFIGHHAFVYPNVKWLQSDGFNDDKTLKNQNKQTNGVYIVDVVGLNPLCNVITAFNSTTFVPRYYIGEVNNFEDLPIEENTEPYSIAYIKNENIMSYAGGTKIWQRLKGVYTNILNYYYNGTTVTDFTIRQPVRLATTEMLDKVQDQVDTNTTTIATKQDTLVSGTNIKTINGNSLLGSGDIEIVANTDLSNLTSQGQNIANWSSSVTNCITEIPQDIKLELTNGTLTLKAGSKVYVPNGAGVFDVVTVSSDAVFTQASAAGKNFLFYTRQNAVTRHPSVASGTSIPSGFTGIFYNTSSNQIYYCSNGTGTESSDDSFPIAIVTVADNQTANISSIDQVFNGFGYIGSTVFALPNVKGLIPNGRNEDGSLKSIEFTTNNVVSYTLPGSYSFTDCPIILNGTNINFFTNYSYNENDNIVNPSGYCLIGTATTSESKITSFTPKTTFHAVDYNDFADLKDQVATKQADVTTLTGYDSTQTQTLKNVNGTLTWVTD